MSSGNGYTQRVKEVVGSSSTTSSSKMLKKASPHSRGVVPAEVIGVAEDKRVPGNVAVPASLLLLLLLLPATAARCPAAILHLSWRRRCWSRILLLACMCGAAGAAQPAAAQDAAAAGDCRHLLLLWLLQQPVCPLLPGLRPTQMNTRSVTHQTQGHPLQCTQAQGGVQPCITEPPRPCKQMRVQQSNATHTSAMGPSQRTCDRQTRGCAAVLAAPLCQQAGAAAAP